MSKALILACTVAIVPVQPGYAAGRAKSPADATVLVRLVGSVRAEIDSFGQKSVITRDRIEIGSGTGFMISADGHVLTNEHVVNSSEITVNEPNRRIVIRVNVIRIEVCFPPESAAARGAFAACQPATIAAADPDLDLAVLYVGGSNQPYLGLGDSDVVTSGQPVQALGFPFGRMLNIDSGSLDSVVPAITTTTGTISAVRGTESGERRALQIDGNVNPGNSGGPVVNKDGFVIGVVRARLKDAPNIAFAIPINQAKAFIESRGLDQLMPVRRLGLGGVQRFDAKGVAIRLPEGMSDMSPYRLHIATDASQADLALRLDRVLSPWTLGRLEQELTRTQSFEQISSAAGESRATTVGNATALVGRALGNSPTGAETGIAYAVIDLGREKLLARFVGPAEQLAFNEGVLRDSLASVDADRLLAGEPESVDKLTWHATSADRRVPVPVGWLVEAGAPSSCMGLSDPASAGTAVSVGDFTVALRVAIWPGTVVPDQAAAQCSSQRGALGATSYATRMDWLGVPYAIEGLFVRTGTQVLQLEVLGPQQRNSYARALLDAWAKRVR